MHWGGRRRLLSSLCLGQSAYPEKECGPFSMIVHLFDKIFDREGNQSFFYAATGANELSPGPLLCLERIPTGFLRNRNYRKLLVTVCSLRAQIGFILIAIRCSELIKIFFGTNCLELSSRFVNILHS